MWQLGATVFSSETLQLNADQSLIMESFKFWVKMDQTPRAAGIKDAYIDMESEPECIFVW